jgi:hypothetical protein
MIRFIGLPVWISFGIDWMNDCDEPDASSAMLLRVEAEFNTNLCRAGFIALESQIFVSSQSALHLLHC